MPGTSWRVLELTAGSDGPAVPVCVSSSLCLSALSSLVVVSTDGGARWTTSLHIDNPATASTSLTSLSCSGSTCVAVGNGSGTRNGRSVAGPAAFVFGSARHGWSAVSLPGVSGAVAEVDSVSCSTADSCVAVGTKGPSAQDQGSGSVVWYTDDAGATWAGTTLSSLPGFLRVACTSPTFCVGVAGGGFAVTTTGPTGFEPVQWPPSWANDSSPVDVEAITCAPASRSCVAVGGVQGPSGTPVIATTTDGTSWSSATVPATLGGSLVGVSCPSVSTCVAVGQSSSTAPAVGATILLETAGNASAWKAVALPEVSSRVLEGILGVSCPTVSFCLAGGAQTAPGDYDVLVGPA